MIFGFQVVKNIIFKENPSPILFLNNIFSIENYNFTGLSINYSPLLKSVFYY